MDDEKSKIKLIEKLIRRENMKKKKIFTMINKRNIDKYKEIRNSITYSFKI